MGSARAAARSSPGGGWHGTWSLHGWRPHMQHSPRFRSARLPRRLRSLGMAVVLLALLSAPSSAQERLCDNSFEDCRASILALIRAERVGIDVSFWFMTDWRYASEI